MQKLQGIANIKKKNKIFLQIKNGPAGMEIFGSEKIHVIGKTGIMVTIYRGADKSLARPERKEAR